MAERYEYYITGDDAARTIADRHWCGVQFTPAAAHKITSVKLKMYKVGSPPTITIGIYEVDGEGKPTGDALCSGSTLGSTLTTDTDGEWREITLGAGYNLDADTMYAIVAKAPGGSTVNCGKLRYDNDDGTYPGGGFLYTDDSGANWYIHEDDDAMFEDWGEEIVIAAGRSFGFIIG